MVIKIIFILYIFCYVSFKMIEFNFKYKYNINNIK